MDIHQRRFRLTAGLLCITLGLFQPLAIVGASEQAQPARPRIGDIQLSTDGSLLGQVVDHRGVPRPGEKVTVARGRDQVEVRSDKNGRFRLTGMRGGTYTLAVNDNVGTVRIWMAGAAPPHAKSVALLVADSHVVRGQCGGGCVDACVGKCKGGYGLYEWISDHPILTYALIATSVAVPIALDDDDDGPPAS